MKLLLVLSLIAVAWAHDVQQSTEAPLVRPLTQAQAYVSAFERRMKAIMVESYKIMSGSARRCSSNSCSSYMQLMSRTGIKEIDVSDINIYGLEKLDIHSSVSRVIDPNLIQINGTMHILHPLINGTVAVTVNGTSSDGFPDDKVTIFRISSFPSKKTEVSFSVIVSTLWNKTLIQWMNFGPNDESNPHYNHGHYNWYSEPEFEPIIECPLVPDQLEICSSLRSYIKNQYFSRIPRKMLSLLEVIASNVRP